MRRKLRIWNACKRLTSVLRSVHVSAQYKRTDRTHDSYRRSRASCLSSCTALKHESKTDVNRLQAFHMRSLRRTLVIRWFDHVTNLEVKDRTRLEDIESRVRWRRLALFGHVARMQPGIPAHDALWTAIGARCGSAPRLGWKRPRGRPRTT